MRIEFTSSGDFEKSISWLDRIIKRESVKGLEAMGRDGVAALKLATPIGETGETANSWDYRIETRHGNVELTFVNNAHMHTSVNVARIIQTGHATGTGGYVPPFNYIKPALRRVMSESATDQLAKEMLE